MNSACPFPSGSVPSTPPPSRADFPPARRARRGLVTALFCELAVSLLNELGLLPDAVRQLCAALSLTLMALLVMVLLATGERMRPGWMSTWRRPGWWLAASLGLLGVCLAARIYVPLLIGAVLIYTELPEPPQGG